MTAFGRKQPLDRSPVNDRFTPESSHSGKVYSATGFDPKRTVIDFSVDSLASEVGFNSVATRLNGTAPVLHHFRVRRLAEHFFNILIPSIA